MKDAGSDFVVSDFRCIAVTTTLSKEKLLQAEPFLIKEDISKIALRDILSLSGALLNAVFFMQKWNSLELL